VIAARSVAEIAAALRRRELSARQVAADALEAIEEWEPRLNAYVAVTRERALDEAAAVDAKLARGDDLGPLMGVPYAVKDILAAKGAPTTGSSRALLDHRPNTDAAIVERLCEAGGVLVGKTNLHELGWGAELGRVGNPLDDSLLAGGSSGGSAATVASGAIPLAVGTDGGGSIRIPAAFCGIVGLKPTAGRVSNRGHLPSASTVGSIGPLARSVADVRSLFAVLADPAHPGPTVSRPPRIGFVRASSTLAEPTIGRSVDRAIDTLARAGWTIEEIELDTRGTTAAWCITYAAELGAALKPWLGNRLKATSEDLRVMIAVGERVPARSYVLAQRLRSRFFALLEDVLTRVDAIATAAVLFPPTAVEPDWGDADFVGNGLWLQAANLTGHPSVVLPLAPRLSGASLQLIGRFGRDELLLDLAEAAEEAL